MKGLDLVRTGYLVVACCISAACGGRPVPGTSGAPVASPQAAAPSSTGLLRPTATVAPPTGRIAFVRDVGEQSQVFIVNTDGSGERRLTDGRGIVDTEELTWAPDGSALYFTAVSRKGCGDTYCYPRHVVSIRPDGTDLRNLGQVGEGFSVGAFFGAKVSPDGRYVAYPAGEGYPDGNGQSFRIPTMVLDLVAGTLASLNASLSPIVWSPEGERLLGFTRDSAQVLDSKTGRTLVRVDDPWVAVDATAGWSGDGESILYHRCDPELDGDQAMACIAGPTWVVDLNDPDLAPQPNVGWEPGQDALSPDRKWRASFMEPNGRPGLYVTPSEGGEPRRIAALNLDGITFTRLPSWSADGAWLAVGTTTGIELVPLSGGQILFVTKGAQPAWQP